MIAEDRLRDALSWAVQLKLAEEAAAYAQRWKPETTGERVSELRITRERSEAARQLALTAGLFAPETRIYIERYGEIAAQ